MSLLDLQTLLKGSAGSGDWGHRGRPGSVGGSGGGAGLASLGLLPTSTASERRATSTRVTQSGKKFKRPTSSDELINKYSPNCDAFPDSCKALRDYTGVGYERINDGLRSGLVMASHTADQISAADTAFEVGSRLEKSIMVTRGASKDVMGKLSVGDSFQDKGYVSTTLNESPPGIADSGVILNMRVPKGSKVLYLEELSGHPSEKELLLPRGSTFNVVKRTTTRTGNIIMDVELVN